MLRICALFVLLSGMASAGPMVSGATRVIDGDTLDVAGVRIRLYGVDAPELHQGCKTDAGTPWRCGEWAADEVTRRYAGQRLDCEALDTDRYGRTVARCAFHGEDIGARLVDDGVIFAYARYSSDYLGVQAQARAARRGLWAGTAQRPEAWRHRAVQAAPGDCRIKGNISNRGRLYHMPGTRWYDVTRVNPARGERWFCSSSEAEAAGFRRAHG